MVTVRGTLLLSRTTRRYLIGRARSAFHSTNDKLVRLIDGHDQRPRSRLLLRMPDIQLNSVGVDLIRLVVQPERRRLGISEESAPVWSPLPPDAIPHHSSSRTREQKILQGRDRALHCDGTDPRDRAPAARWCRTRPGSRPVPVIRRPAARPPATRGRSCSSGWKGAAGLAAPRSRIVSRSDRISQPSTVEMCRSTPIRIAPRLRSR